MERGEGGAVNTSLSSGPNRAPLAHSRLRRVRPIQRESPAGLSEAAPREGAANQRWYSDMIALCPISRLSGEGQGVFFYAAMVRGKYHVPTIERAEGG